MKREVKRITERGSYEFGDNYKLILKDDEDKWVTDCNITCGNNCKIDCASECNIICENKCGIKCGCNCNITCGINCGIKCGWNCNIICGNDCIIYCEGICNITCKHNCKIVCGYDCNITCGSNCEIILDYGCYIKAGEGSKIHSYGNLLKTILKDEEGIWWYFYIYKKYNLINTFEDVNWQRSKPDKYKELYFVTDELDSATLF